MENQASGVDKKEWKVLGEESQMQTIEKVLKDPNCLKDLNRLKEQILFVPIDKAGNNIGLISKKNFLEVLHLETKSNTYIWFCESIINAVGKKNLRDRHTCNTRQQDTSTDSCHHQDAQESCKISVHLCFLWWALSAKRKDHHGVSSGWSSVWHRSNTGLSSTQYEQVPIILGVWPFWLTRFVFRSITFWRAYG